MSSYEISKSSLLSLKAEILRKQDDLAKAKQENVEKIRIIKKKALEFKNKGIERRQLNDLDTEEQNLLKLSRSRLEAKSKLYNKLVGSKLSEETKQKYLVQFDKKTSEPPFSDSEEPPDLPVESEDEERHDSDYYDDENVNDADEWVEYTDCLGRSRKCLRKDLEYVKMRDADLKESAEKRNQAADPEERNQILEEGEKIDEEPDPRDAESEMISGDMRREMLRRQWEREEEELREKTEIHYQNILFDEARQHGVGYYAFSKDEEERLKQQEALKKLRSETAQEQKKAQQLKALRERQMAARMKAARDRRRARLGLPPEEEQEAPPSASAEVFQEEEKKIEEQRKKEEAEKILAEARKQHVRPWDVGKEGMSKFYEMSQKEWNEKKRKERPEEFAPPEAYSAREFSSMKTLECHYDESDKFKFSTKNTTIKKQKLTHVNPYKHSQKSHDENDDCLIQDYLQSGAYQKEDLLNHHVSPEIPPKSIPIINELEEPDDILTEYHKLQENTSSKRKGTEIPPPPNLISPEVPKPKNLSGNINIADSIEAGLKFLRNQTERKRRRNEDDIF